MARVYRGPGPRTRYGPPIGSACAGATAPAAESTSSPAHEVVVGLLLVDLERPHGARGKPCGHPAEVDVALPRCPVIDQAAHVREVDPDEALAEEIEPGGAVGEAEPVLHLGMTDVVHVADPLGLVL